MDVLCVWQVRVFAAFGMLSNLTRAAMTELRSAFATHCAPAEQASALRELLTFTLNAAEAASAEAGETLTFPRAALNARSTLYLSS